MGIMMDVLELPLDERAAAVDAACAGDPELKQRVLDLLAEDNSAAGFLEPNPAALLGAFEAGTLDTIGAYKIKARIAEGGFGVVYRADQFQPIARTVALKVIKPGMDSYAVVRRFETERQTLGLMEHPNIATVFDGGIIPDGVPGAGRPYFVMEFVDGEPITAFAKRAGLGLEDRVDLVLQACAAAQHAHAKGVIHRDLKPSNVLVTTVDARPLCKIIDFGISKAIGGADPGVTAFTSPGAMVGTPQYMSPEQAQGVADIDIRTDVYSLGTILYELLSGLPPFDRDSVAGTDLSSLRQVILDTDPKPPSTRLSYEAVPTLSPKDIRGDLDWITMRAMAKEPERRYETVAAMASDLRRYLRSEPVDASPPSTAYRVRKFVRRNRALVAAGSIASVGVLAGSAASVWFGFAASSARADEEQQRLTAEAERRTVEDINDFLLSDLFFAVDVVDLGPEAKLADLLDRSAPLIDNRFSGNEPMLARMHGLFGTMYYKLTRFGQSLDHYNEAIERTSAQDPPDAESLADLLHWRAQTYLGLGQLDEAEADVRRAVNLLDEDDPPDWASMPKLTGTLATLLQSQRRFDEAAPLFEIALSVPDTHPEVDAQFITTTRSHQISMLFAMERFEDCLAGAEDMLEYISGLDDGVAIVSRLTAEFWRGQALRRLGRAQEAADSAIETIALGREVYGPQSPFYASLLTSAGTLLAELDRRDEAERYLLDAMPIYEEVFGPHHYNIEQNTNRIARTYDRWGMAEQYRAWRTRGLLLRLYVAGPGEPDSVHGVMVEGEALYGGMDAWIERVTAEIEQVPPGHNKRARYLTHAAMVLDPLETEFDVESAYLDAFAALGDAERPSEVRKALLRLLPAYYDANGRPADAHAWRERLAAPSD